MSNTRELPWQLDTSAKVLPTAQTGSGPTTVESNVVQVAFGASRDLEKSAQAIDQRSAVLNHVLRKAQLLGW